METYEKLSRSQLIQLLADSEALLRAQADDEKIRLLHDLHLQKIELEIQNLDLKESRQELEDARNEYADLYEFAPVGFLTLDAKGRIIALNLTAASMLGQDRSYLPGYPLSMFLKQGSGGALFKHLRTASSGKTPAIDEFTLKKENDESEKTLRVACKVHQGEDGEQLFLMALSDLTKRETTERHLLRAKKMAEAELRNKSSFLAAASHELRQSLQAIRLFSSILDTSLAKYENIRKEDLEALSFIALATEELGELLGKLLDLSKLESGTISPKPTSFALQEILDHATANFQTSARRKGLEFRVMRCSAVVFADKLLLQQILANLISNAIRYTKQGRIIVGCRRDADSIRIEVWDTGMGIAQENIERIFREYDQIDNPLDEQSKGLGLGLSIARKLCSLLALKLEVRSELGKGSVFSVALPMIGSIRMTPSPPRAVTSKTSSKESLAACRILVVDDDDLVLKGMVNMLAGLGVRVEGAKSASAARKLVFGGEFVPDLLIIDYQLNGEYIGLQLCGELQDLIGVSTPAILMTGTTDPEQINRLDQSGYYYLLKPIKPAVLTQKLHHFLIDERRRLPVNRVSPGGRDDYPA